MHMHAHFIYGMHLYCCLLLYIIAHTLNCLLSPTSNSFWTYSERQETDCERKTLPRPMVGECCFQSLLSGGIWPSRKRHNGLRVWTSRAALNVLTVLSALIERPAVGFKHVCYFGPNAVPSYV